MISEEFVNYFYDVSSLVVIDHCEIRRLLLNDLKYLDALLKMF